MQGEVVRELADMVGSRRSDDEAQAGRHIRLQGREDQARRRVGIGRVVLDSDPRHLVDGARTGLVRPLDTPGTRHSAFTLQGVEDRRHGRKRDGDPCAEIGADGLDVGIGHRACGAIGKPRVVADLDLRPLVEGRLHQGLAVGGDLLAVDGDVDDLAVLDLLAEGPGRIPSRHRDEGESGVGLDLRRGDEVVELVAVAE